MKFLIFLMLFAYAVVCIVACNPKGSNKPKCDDGNVDKRIRNFNDPNRYWLCKSANGEPENVRCEKEQAFDEGKGKCVPFKEFKWTKPCASSSDQPSVQAKPVSNSCKQ